MTQVNVHEAKTHLSRLLDRAAAGERITIAKAGNPVAELGPIVGGRELGFLSFHTPASFFEELTDDELRVLGMIRLLLDTHVLLWAIAEPDRLSRRAREVIATNENELHISSASAWEIAMKHRLGKLPGAEVLLASYTKQLERLGAVDLAVSSTHALVAGSFDVEHRDPFDRMIAAQAAVEGLDIVSSDSAFADFEGLGVRVVW